ncbi:MAG: winged helix-turn-helix transcriptional regulator [Rhodospirillales bacterium]|nr:winged helix-turn-helix transcriptional regulator [Rhodospirillales bacterium]
MASKRGRNFARVSARRDTSPDGPHPMIGVKLWKNPCRLSFRVNFIAHHFNQPLYDWIWRELRLTMPEHIVLYALALKDGITADDIAASTARPKNTLSRGVNAVLRKKLIERRADPRDRRRLILTLTARGRRIVARTVPAFVAHENGMASALTAAERRTLEALLEKIILEKPNWPTQIQGRP